MQKTTGNSCKKTYYLLVSFFILLNIYLASRSFSSIPLVDGWALWNQMMLVDLSQTSFFNYTFSYFGAHPHSIIKILGWLDYRVSGGQQILTAIASCLSFAALAYFLNSLFFSWSNKHLKSSSHVLIIGILIAILSTDLADWEVTTLPFQSVLSISRLAYIVLLWFFLKGLERNSNVQLSILAIMAGIATTFHGSGFIFALIWLMVGLVHYRHVHNLALSLPPIIIWFVQAHFYKNGGELDSLGSVLSLGGFLNIFSAFLLYFTTPLLPFYEASYKPLYIFIGLIIASFTIWLGLYGLISLFKARAKCPDGTIEINETAYAGVLCIFVILSGLAASILMTVRAGDFADSQMMTTSRYISYAIFPYALIIICLAKASEKRKTLKPIFIVCISLVAFASFYPTLNRDGVYAIKLNLDRSIAFISAGFSPLENDSMFIWPNARDDWYWVNALPQTISYLQEKKIGPWYNLPLLGQSYSGSALATPVNKLVYSKYNTSIDCSLSTFEGIVEQKIPSSYLDHGVLPVLDANGLVVGFAYQKSPSSSFIIAGIVNEKTSQHLDKLYIGPRNVNYKGQAFTNSIEAYELTDTTWDNGVARSWPGFFVADNPGIRKLLSNGKVLRFDDGSVRAIDKQIVANGFLNIYTAPPLIDSKNGFPKKIKVTGWCKSH